MEREEERMEQKNEQASGPDAGAAGEGSSPRTGLLTEVLTREGAPWRPFEDKGLLVQPWKSAQLAKALVAACEPPMLTHLKAVCLWPEKQRNRSWRVGDYSFYVLSFEPAPGRQSYVQFWSAPDESGVVFEVSSGALDRQRVKTLDAAKQELIRDHGFEVAGSAGNFRKTVSVADAKDLRGLAREALAILTQVLDWNGTQALEYELSLQSGSKIRHVLEAVSPETLTKLLREWGFPAELKLVEGKPPLIESRTDHGRFGVLFGDQSEEDAREYQALRVRTFRGAKDPEAAEQAARLVNERFAGLKASVDEDGDLMIETLVLLHEGVTAEHLRARFEMWRYWVGETGEGRLEQ
jgi:hypothetical protein